MKLSVIFCGRNDNYNGDFLGRLSLSIMSLQRVLSNTEWELILVDYNPPDNSKLLCELYPQNNIKHLVVSKNLHTEFIQRHIDCGAQFLYKNKDIKSEIFNLCNFMPHMGVNYGLQFAQGEYVLSSSTDNIFNKSLEQTITKLEPNILYRSWRKNIHAEKGHELFDHIVSEREYSNDSDMISLNNNRKKINKATGDFLLVDKATWVEIGGYIPITHPRPVHIDSLFMYYLFLIGKRGMGVQSCLVNMHKESPIQYTDLAAYLNYVINYNGVYYNHFSELCRPSYSKYRQLGKSPLETNKCYYFKGNKEDEERRSEVKEMFKNIWDFKNEKNRVQFIG